jgi:hypothetical protein
MVINLNKKEDQRENPSVVFRCESFRPDFRLLEGQGVGIHQEEFGVFAPLPGLENTYH